MQSNTRSARRAHGFPGRAPLALALIAASGMTMAAWGNPQADAGGVAKNQAGNAGGIETAERMVIPLGQGTGPSLRVARPDAFQSEAIDAKRLPPEMLRSAPRHTVFGRTIVQAESREKVAAALTAIQAEFAWLNERTIVESDALPGVFVLDLRTVRNAVRAAEILRVQPGIIDASVEFEEAKKPRGGGGDPALSAQWHIDNTMSPAIDQKIAEVHADGITGQNVVVGVLEAFRGNFTSPYNPADLADPNFDFSSVVHPDLFGNFNRSLSQQTDPFQIDVFHETAVAGIIGAVADNGAYGRGVAFGSQIAALRNGSTLEGAEAFAHELNRIHIVNNSWGPGNVSFPPDTTGLAAIGADNFEVFPPEVSAVHPASVRLLAIERGLDLGRNKKGRVYTFSAGNENHFQGWDRFRIGNAISLPQFGYLDIVDTAVDGPLDDFEFSGGDVEGWRYSGMIGDRTEYWPIAGDAFTMAIGAVGEDNVLAGYSTTGTALLAAAYSQQVQLDRAFGAGGYGGSVVGRGIATTAPLGTGSNCPGVLGLIDGLTCTFNGTSASAPVASGVFALMLETNPNLTTRDIQHILQRTSVPLNFDPTTSYWTNLFGFGTPDPDDTSGTNVGFWQSNSADVLHSDEYGFGLIDAEAAVDMARDWGQLPRLYILDTGELTEGIELDIPDAEFEELGELSETQVLNALVPGEIVSAGRELASGVAVPGLACVRENFIVEAVEVTLTIAGVGPGDLFIVLESPRGTASPLAIPRADSSVVVSDQEYSYSNYTFTTYKHWGELSSGTWSIFFQDWRPDDESPEGTLPSDDDPGEEQITLLGPLGLPGAAFQGHSEKQLVGARLRIYATDAGLPPTFACPALLTSCPGDLNGDGIINSVDLQLFLQWYLDGDPLADITGDGVLNFDDIQAFRGIWIPGYCNRAPGGSFGRPVNPPSVGPDNPIIRPI